MQTHGIRAGQEGAKKGIGFIEVFHLHILADADYIGCLPSKTPLFLIIYC